MVSRYRLRPLAQWFTEAGIQEEFSKRCGPMDKESLRIQDGKVYVLHRNRRVELPIEDLHLIAVPQALVPELHYPWISSAETEARMVWYIGDADSVTTLRLKLEAIRMALSKLRKGDGVPNPEHSLA